jgi:hypothetical protein
MRSKLRRLFPRVAFGAALYWAANAALLAAEVRWHVLSRLIAFDLRAAEVIPALIAAKLLGVSVALTLSGT